MANVIEKDGFVDRANLMSNCGQIFAKGPALTREIISKVQRGERVTQHQKFLCGREFRTRHIWVLAGLLILFSTCLFGSIVLWCTNYFDVMILSNLELKEGTDAFESFIHPKVDPYLKVNIFNYTNTEAFILGTVDKLHVEEVGPFVFKEHTQRVNIKFGRNGTVSFQEKKSYKFIPQLSNGLTQLDELVVPNLPMLGAIAIIKDANLMTRLALSTVLNGFKVEPFLRLTAQDFIWGYDDSFFMLVKSVMSFQKDLPFEKFGLLSPKAGLIPDKVTVSTGQNDISTVGTVVRFNGQDKMGHWSTSECNRIDGTLGSFFSPYTVRNKEPVSIYQKDLCRKLPLFFDAEVNILDNTYPAYRYKPPQNVFAHPEHEPTNKCYCDQNSGVCPPHGVINSTPCAYGPAYLSFPHFLHGDPNLREDITGMHPDEEIHSSHLDLHPTFGYTMAGTHKLQLNMLVRTVFGVPQVDIFKDQTMLPIVWFDSGIDAIDLPSSIVDIFYRTTYTIPYIHVALQYGSLLITLITLITMAILIQGRIKRIRNTCPIRTIPPFQRNISGLDALIQ